MNLSPPPATNITNYCNAKSNQDFQEKQKGNNARWQGCTSPQLY